MAMLKANTYISQTISLLSQSGMLPFGWFNAEGQPALLIGNVSSTIWKTFSTSTIFSDGEANPLDRWTKAQVDPVGQAVGAQVRYPFEKPFWPFQQYARQATGMEQSPIGLMIHPQYGPWIAFRAALVFEEVFDYPSPNKAPHPCNQCSEKPCLSTCPVGAFTAETYDYEKCKSHVRSPEGIACRQSGCLARRSCPVGPQFVYDDDYQAFHMAAYV